MYKVLEGHCKDMWFMVDENNLIRRVFFSKKRAEKAVRLKNKYNPGGKDV